MLGNSLTGLDRKSLRRWLIIFFLALLIPTGILVYQSYSQLKWETIHQYQVQAEELLTRIDAAIIELVNNEEVRSFSEYTFLNVAGDPAASFLQRSPLSAYPQASAIPGLVGYFQVNTEGVFTTPLLPSVGVAGSDYGITAVELEQRQSLQQTIQQILNENRLVQSSSSGNKISADASLTYERQDQWPARQIMQDMDAMDLSVADDRIAAATVGMSEEQLAGQHAFDRLNKAAVPLEQKRKQFADSSLGRVKDLKLDYSYQSEAEDAAQQQITSRTAMVEKRARKERSVLPEALNEYGSGVISATSESDVLAPSRVQGKVRIRTFESEIDPFEFSLLDSGHFVLFRKVWRDGQRYIQGVLIEQQPFVQALIETMFLDTALSTMSDLLVAYRGDVLMALSGKAERTYLSSTESLRGTLLYQTHLSAPLGDVQLILSVNHLPAGPGGKLISWLAVILLLLLCGGFYLMYRLGARQIDLTNQQQDFVSAVSHELKTPLTSIRMYGEILREGWAPDEKKKVYYDYIFDESERLSRLITNVLQLARMTRNKLPLDRKPLTVAELMDRIRSKVSSQCERAGFVLNFNCAADAEQAIVRVDPDRFTQIFINLVDNAIKFSGRAEHKVIDIGCQRLREDHVQFSVRDYGPGIPANQMKKIFKLFYRSENELTRETVGTGIGLALVDQLARAMNGQVDIVNREPGAEFQLLISVA